MKNVIREIGGRVRVPAVNFASAVANAELGGSVDFTNSRSDETRYSHYYYEVQKYVLKLPSLKELRKDYLEDVFFSHLRSVKEAISFMETNRYYYIEEMILGEAIPIRVVSKARSGARAGLRM